MFSKTYYLESLGCAKNTVDSQSILHLLTQNGWSGTTDPERASVLLVNTCGFIQTARDESLACLSDLSQNKKKKQLLIAAGCMAERFRQSILDSAPGVDGFLNTNEWMNILDLISSLRGDRSKSPAFETEIPRFAIQSRSAYLKIADGCHRRCAFCTIPLIKGNLKSRPASDVLSDVVLLNQQKVAEINLVAQDSSSYGIDRDKKAGLSSLLKDILAASAEIPWLRILYLFPGCITDELLEVFSSSERLLPYFDIPLQHADPGLLRKMHRPDDVEETVSTIHKIRKNFPQAVIRTTFIVGFPGEEEKEFSSLVDFVREVRFDHVGVFQYSWEKDAPAGVLGDPIPGPVKQERYNRLMELQQGISLSIHQKLIGRKMRVLVEGKDNGISIARSYRDAPEIDGYVLVEGEAPQEGFVDVQITGALPYDLTARVIP